MGNTSALKHKRDLRQNLMHCRLEYYCCHLTGYVTQAAAVGEFGSTV